MFSLKFVKGYMRGISLLHHTSVFYGLAKNRYHPQSPIEQLIVKSDSVAN